MSKLHLTDYEFAAEPGGGSCPRKPDGYSLYRALARQLIGSHVHYLEIRDAVIAFAVRARLPDHPLHSEYCRRENGSTLRPLFTNLDFPDFYTRELHWVVANALKIRLDVYMRDSPPFEQKDAVSEGSPTYGVCSVVLHWLQDSLPQHLRLRFPGLNNFATLLPDQSGKELVVWLSNHVRLQEQHRAANLERKGPQFKRISWRVTGDGVECCLNEYLSIPDRFQLPRGNPLDRLDTFVITVSDAEDLGAALGFLKRAVERAPYQNRKVRVTEECKWGEMLPHCSVDAEFATLPRDATDTTRTVDNGGLEHLCSVLTFAVGKHFFLVINILHMLENPTKATVPEFEKFFKATIFDPSFLKLWWNPAQDISVLDDTIAHLYQKDKRHPYRHWIYGTTRSCVIYPQFRLKSPFFETYSRPEELKFSHQERQCDLHKVGANERGIHCSCHLGNIDLAALLNHMCRLHGKNVPLQEWHENRYGFNYGHLLQAMLGSDHLYRILDFMKDRARNHPRGKLHFYRNLGRPDIGQDSHAMAYLIGDVAGQNLVFEQMIASDDIRLVGTALDAYEAYQSRPQLSPLRLCCQRPSPLGVVEDPDFNSRSNLQYHIPLVDDNPRCFPTRTYAGREAERYSTNKVFWKTERLRPWEHNLRVQVTRKAAMYNPPDGNVCAESLVVSCMEQEDPYRKQTLGEQDPLSGLKDLYDPRKFWVPTTCAKVMNPLPNLEQYEDPIVRAGATHIEALIEFLKSKADQARTTSPPEGFGALSGSPDGIPLLYCRVVGRSIPLAWNLFAVLSGQPDHAVWSLGQRTVTHQERLVNMRKQQEFPEREVIERVNAAKESLATAQDSLFDSEDLKRLWRANATEAARERQLNAASGRPAQLDTSDLCDPEGREYRRRRDVAASWNRPPIVYMPSVTKSGHWKSQATATLSALEKHAPKLAKGMKRLEMSMSERDALRGSQ